jgi:hypothetical protein
VDLLEVHFGRLVGSRLVAPEALADLEGAVEARAPVLEGHAVGFVLFALPADADAQVEPAAGQHVQRGGLLGQVGRPSQAGDQDARHQARVGRQRGPHRQHGQWVQPVAFGAGRLHAALHASELRVCIGFEPFAQHDVVRHHEPVDAGGVGCARLVQQGLPPARARVAGREVQGLDREGRGGGV